MFIHEIDLIKRIDPSNPLELNQVTVYLILKNEKERERYERAIREIESIMDDKRCPYKHLKILYRTKDLMNRVGDKSSIAAFQEYNIMVRLFNHPTNHCYKYSFGLLSNLENPNWVAIEFLQFLSEAACENMISLTASMWLYQDYPKEKIERIIQYFIPLVALRGEKGADNENILQRWEDTYNLFAYDRIPRENEQDLDKAAWNFEYFYCRDVRALPHEMAFQMPDELMDEDVTIELIEGQYRQSIDFNVKVHDEEYPFHLRTNIGTFIYTCILLSKVRNFRLYRNDFKSSRGSSEEWMRQLLNWITKYKVTYDEMMSSLAGGQYDYQSLNNEISKINKAIREDISDPIIQERCIIKKNVHYGDTYYYVDLLPENINLVCPFPKPKTNPFEEDEFNIATSIPK